MDSAEKKLDLSPIELAKRLACHMAVDENYPENPKVIGIGSGSTVVYVVERLLTKPGVDSVVFIPTGFQSKQLIVNNGLRLGDPDCYPNVDVSFDGADEVDDNLQCIKGGGACLFQEKLIAFLAKRLVIVADSRKNSHVLGEYWKKGVPIEVMPMAYASILPQLVELGAIEPKLRMGAPGKAGPVVTDNGNFIIDAHFGLIKNPKELFAKIKLLVGVVEVGLFCDMISAVYFGSKDGSVTVKKASGEKHIIPAPVTAAANEVDAKVAETNAKPLN
ncbi:Ribose-5-phosphate isomerase [Schizosaccharomyces pombe]|uniref:Ribose-5-phosphate isomerase n=1 Tax=Schizosaccharomyces pombe (strain 972 / ATCC 24843) TaxID=284812 RepID=RPIA_SCHPO|nr:putative ribose 5-phosphate isomerase [Schizosaccharomyces pombe]Q9UTL3.1 RecName: Full=Ribose-5-phosphate isomerase; AltName: Full=D-ribose-5-phosphate ketol-isomerase; AltName: Full=Phosphoriboisomerase [Schizosaccharomyces pombe 972h-]CAB59692.1 ribose 5-phosphate isomerase (predicted) [Schizosaccharomyces pombe]|eukprot:NP_594673.1 putative ribose 5-phosphate isomerase [Schizosaccharomyces pombe]